MSAGSPSSTEVMDLANLKNIEIQILLSQQRCSLHIYIHMYVIMYLYAYIYICNHIHMYVTICIYMYVYVQVVAFKHALINRVHLLWERNFSMLCQIFWNHLVYCIYIYGCVAQTCWAHCVSLGEVVCQDCVS